MIELLLIAYALIPVYIVIVFFMVVMSFLDCFK